MNHIRKAMQSLPGHWYKGDMTDFQGNYCGLGHVAKAFNLSDEDISFESFGEHYNEITEIMGIMHDTAKEMFPDRTWASPSLPVNFANVNDHPETTEEEILSVMEKAATRYDEKVD